MAATEITKQTMEIRKTKKQRELNTWKCVRIPAAFVIIFRIIQI